MSATRIDVIEQIFYFFKLKTQRTNDNHEIVPFHLFSVQMVRQTILTRFDICGILKLFLFFFFFVFCSHSQMTNVIGTSVVERLSFYNHTECECREKTEYDTNEKSLEQRYYRHHQPSPQPQNMRRAPPRKS